MNTTNKEAAAHIGALREIFSKITSDQRVRMMEILKVGYCPNCMGAMPTSHKLPCYSCEEE